MLKGPQFRLYGECVPRKTAIYAVILRKMLSAKDAHKEFVSKLCGERVMKNEEMRGRTGKYHKNQT